MREMREVGRRPFQVSLLQLILVTLTGTFILGLNAEYGPEIKDTYCSSCGWPVAFYIGDPCEAFRSESVSVGPTPAGDRRWK